MESPAPPLIPDEVRELLAARIHDVPDYPKPGVMFKDITRSSPTRRRSRP